MNSLIQLRIGNGGSRKVDIPAIFHAFILNEILEDVPCRSRAAKNMTFDKKQIANLVLKGKKVLKNFETVQTTWFKGSADLLPANFFVTQ